MATVAPGDEDLVTVTLHKRESSGGAGGYWGHPGICAVTFCEGDATSVFATLKQKARAVLDANPWICGTLTKQKTLVHPKTGSDALVEALVQMKSDSRVTR